MKVFILRSGGLANLRVQGEVDTDDLPEDLGKRAVALLQPEKLRGVQPSADGVPDAFQYEIRLQAENGEYETFRLDDPSHNPDLCDVLDGLIRVLTQKHG